jgi:hypothetical protein
VATASSRAYRLERRVETHIFLCVLAYHLLVCIERAFLEQGIHTSWETLRRQLSTHQVVTVRLPPTDGQAFTTRYPARANPPRHLPGAPRSRPYPLADHAMDPK